MIPAQRRRDILKVIAAEGSGTIAELSQKYGVSEMTIRRDLKTLEEEGQLQYTFGGAVALQDKPFQPETDYQAKAHLHTEQKTRLARYAAENFVDDHDVIVLEPGTTVAAMAQFLAQREHLTVVTNGLHTTVALQSLLSRATVICTGGILRDVSFSFVGPLAEGFFKQFYARKLFLSGIGFTLDAGLTDPQMIDTQVKKAMIAHAEQVIVLLDSSKFGVRSFIPVISAGDIDVLITDEDAPAPVVAALHDLGVDVHLVPQ